MMSIDIKEETHLFAELLRKTDIYLEYTEARNAIKQDPELYRQVNEFRQRNFDLQHNTREEDLMDAADAFEREENENGILLEGIISRKKQLIPTLMNAMAEKV